MSNTHVLVVDWLRRQTDDNCDNDDDSEKQYSEMQVVHVFDNRWHRITVAAWHSGIAALGNESNQTNDQTDHEAPECSLEKRHTRHRRSGPNNILNIMPTPIYLLWMYVCAPCVCVHVKGTCTSCACNNIISLYLRVCEFVYVFINACVGQGARMRVFVVGVHVCVCVCARACV